MKLFSYPIGTDVFGETIQQCLRKARNGSLFRVAVAYISVSGAKKLEKHLKILSIKKVQLKSLQVLISEMIQ